MKTDDTQEEETSDVVYDEDQGAELIKKLRAKLKKSDQEKKEYLDGWQRLKADSLNARKLQVDALSASRERAVNDFVHELLPALDSFDIAFRGEAWEKVDDVWRKGIEYVHAQLLTSLENSGVVSYGEVGDVFDPKLHDAAGHEDGGESDTVARVERRGYKIGENVVRPAHVVVYN